MKDIGKRLFVVSILTVLSLVLLSGCQSSESENEKETTKATTGDENPSTHNPHPNAQSPLGINISRFNYWSTEWPLVDAMKTSSGWSPQCNPYGDELSHNLCKNLKSPANASNTGEGALIDLDENGWVKSLPDKNDPNITFRSVATLLFQGNGGSNPSGQYIVLYDGKGTIQYNFNAKKNEELSKPGRDVLDVSSDGGGIKLSIVETDPDKTGNYIRNVRVIWPGGICNNNPFDYHYESGTCSGTFTSFEENHENQRFHPKFLNDLRKYKLIRFMPYLNINVTEIKLRTWDDRPKSTNAFWTGEQGSPLDVAIDLVNRIHADPWINIHAYVTDDYIRNFAILAKNSLGSEQKIYVEYGNEAWNDAYPYNVSGFWMRDEGMKLWPDATNDDSGNLRRFSFFGKRSSEICAIWKEVWAEESNRVKCVMGGMVNSWINEQSLNCSFWANENGGTPCYENMDAFAIAPYFGGYLGDEGNQQTIESWAEFQFTDQNLLALQNDNWPTDVPDDQIALLAEMKGAVFQGKIAFQNALDAKIGEANRIDYWTPIVKHAQIPTAGLDKIFNELNHGGLDSSVPEGALQTSINAMKANSVLIDKYGLEMIAYESGQHLVGVDSAFNSLVNRSLFINANRDPRMGELHKKYGSLVFSVVNAIPTFTFN